MKSRFNSESEGSRSIKVSTVLFWLCAAFMVAMGVTYLVWPIAPYHEEIIEMSASELAGAHPSINELVTTLVNLAGISFLSLGVIMALLGTVCWRNRLAWYTMLSLIPLFLVPLIYLVARVGGPVLLIVPPTVLVVIAFYFSGFRERRWE